MEEYGSLIAVEVFLFSFTFLRLVGSQVTFGDLDLGST